MKYIASVSWGKDSLAMLLRLIENDAPLDEVVFYDTGMEFKAIYTTRDMMRPVLERHGITIIDEPYLQVYYFTNRGFLETSLYYHTKFYRRPPEKGE